MTILETFRATRLSDPHEGAILSELLASLPAEELKTLTQEELIWYFDGPSPADDHAGYHALSSWCDGRAVIPREVTSLVRRLQARNAQNAPNLDMLLAYVAPTVFSLTEVWKWSCLTDAGAKLAAEIDASWRATGRIQGLETDVLENEFWIDRVGVVMWAAERSRERVLAALKKGIREAKGQKRVVFAYWREQIKRAPARRG